MKIEKIVASKLVNVPQKDGSLKPLYLITDSTGAKIWAPKEAFDPTANLVTYEPFKKGDKYTAKDGAEGTHTQDTNQFQGYAHYSKLDILVQIKDLGLSNPLTI